MAEQTSGFGYGHIDPTDSTDQFNIICALARSLIFDLDTMKLVKVVAVTGGGVDKPPGTVDVKPLVNQIDGNGNAQPHGTVHGIPWTRLQAGKNAFVLDPQVDDVGWVACADRDGSVVQETGKQANPGSRRAYSIADGVYVGGVLGPSPEQYIAILDTGIDIKDKFGNRIQTLDDANSIAITSKGDVLVDANGGSGNLAVMGSGAFSGALEVDGAINAQGGIQVEGGSSITRWLTGSVTTTFGPGTLAAFASVTVTQSVPGAKVGDYVQIARPSTGAPNPTSSRVYGYVSTANTVSVICSNITSSVITVTPGTYQILVTGTT